MFEYQGDCDRRESLERATAVCALPRNDMVFRQSVTVKSPFDFHKQKTCYLF